MALQKRHRRHKRVRAKVCGTASRPRFFVFRSSKHIYAQLIDDEKGKTLAAASDGELKRKTKSEKRKTIKMDLAHEVGKLIAQKALDKKITEVVFDRGWYKYHGRVKALAEGAREGGLEF